MPGGPNLKRLTVIKQKSSSRDSTLLELGSELAVSLDLV